MTARTRAELLQPESGPQFQSTVARAAELLRAGRPVAIPTETVYGLAANAYDPAAVEQLFAIKGRPAGNPLIVHVAGVAMAQQCVAHWPAEAQNLAAAFWPGPLTLVLPRSHRIPRLVTGGGDTVGVRWPNHQLATAIIEKCGFPLAAPSANLSTQLSPTTAQHVLQNLGDQIPLIVDGGRCQVGLESTVLNLAGDPPAVLRPGMIHSNTLSAVLGRPVVSNTNRKEAAAGPLQSPGMLAKHYSPKAPLYIRSWSNETELHQHLHQLNLSPEKTHLISYARVPSPDPFEQVILLPHEPEAYARALYAALHTCDQAGANAIVVEQPPAEPNWLAIFDRLQRAAHQQPHEITDGE